MSTIGKEVQAALELANDSYRSGYLEGYRAGQRDAIAHAIKLVEALPTTAAEAAARAESTSSAEPT